MIDFSIYLPAYTPVELPSKGRLYAPDFPLNSGWVHIRPEAGPEEAILYTWNGENADMVINSILRSCIQEQIDVEQMTTEDVFYLMVWLRANSYNSLYDFEATCPYRDCLHGPDKYTVNLATDLNHTILDETITEPYEVKLPRTGITVYIKCLRRSTEMKAQKRKTDIVQWRNYKGDPTELLKRAYSITKVMTPDGKETEDILDIEKLCLYFLPAEDSLLIDEALMKFHHGVENDILFHCHVCKRDIHTTLPSGPEFFRPSRRNIYDEGVTA